MQGLALLEDSLIYILCPTYKDACQSPVFMLAGAGKGGTAQILPTVIVYSVVSFSNYSLQFTVQYMQMMDKSRFFFS